ncbi:MAG TPA: orotidine-5'-phosphate decarboxylase, partial [Acidimicrobiia bacterium]|nr:orotidine-5'-phosphate decarboxylase [Acidimicrobiia bacterium]
LHPLVGGFKVGLELLMGEGPAVVSRVAALGAPVFVDAKLHDIPNTVAGAAARLGSIGARWVTVHASGGEEMMRAAVEALAAGAEPGAGVLAVTVLTSLDEATLRTVGFGMGAAEQTGAMARLAAAAGAEGVVCAVPEAETVKALGLGLTVATPGIRPAGAERADQRRVATPGEAIRRGADLLVVGRPITAAADPIAAAEAVSKEIEAAVSAAGAGHAG